MPISEVYNMDCMEYMKDIPNAFYDLAIIDPPYGIGEDGLKNHSRGNRAKAKQYAPKTWDRAKPQKHLFDELMRVSKNQIIFGVNHFISQIPYDSPCWVVWDKKNGKTDFADCELAWTSFNKSAKLFAFRWSGFLQEDMKNKEVRIHPTQKPVALYKFLLETFSKPGNRILDTHLGSGSSRIAAYKMGFDFWGTEIDEEYFNMQEKRFREECIGEVRLKTSVYKQKELFEL